MPNNDFSESLRRIERRQGEAERRDEQRGGRVETRFDARVQTGLAVLTVIVSIAMAYGALDKRIALLEQKLDAISAQVGRIR